jgi:hypothetical protein
VVREARASSSLFHVNKRYDTSPALEDVNLSIERARSSSSPARPRGQDTLLKLLFCDVKATSGRSWYRGNWRASQLAGPLPRRKSAWSSRTSTAAGPHRPRHRGADLDVLGMSRHDAQRRVEVMRKQWGSPTS